MAASIWNPGGQQQVPALPAVAPVSFVKGTVGNPGINFVGDTDTGIWSESDGYLNFVVNGVTQLRIDPLGNITANKFSGGVELDVASAAVTDIGAVASNSVRVTGANAISSFGTTYRGPMFVRFASALTLTHNATTLICPGAASISINAGDSIVVTPKATGGAADGWVVVSYTSGSPNLNAVSSINNGQLAGLRNRIINGSFAINQRGVSGTVTLAAGVYGHDRWKAGASGCTYTFATANNVTTLTISAGSLMQVIEGLNLDSGSFRLSWGGTAQGRVDSGAYGASASVVTGTNAGGVNQTVEFGTGTLSKVMYEIGSVATPFEQRPYGMELALCRRYARADVIGCVGATTSGSPMGSFLTFDQPMRTNPTSQTWVGNLFASGFPNTIPTFDNVLAYGYRHYKTANATGSSSSYLDSVLTSAEL